MVFVSLRSARSPRKRLLVHLSRAVEALALKKESVTHIVPLTGGLSGKVRIQSFEVDDGEFSGFENISKALIRLDQGIYGRCTCCGGRIEMDVLIEAPLAKRCIACAHQESHP